MRRCRGEGWRGSGGAPRWPLRSRQILSRREGGAALLRSPALPAARAVRRHHRWVAVVAETRRGNKTPSTPTTSVCFCSSGTFKIQKTRLRKEGYRPRQPAGEVYFLDSQTGRYQDVTSDLCDAIDAGRVRLWGLREREREKEEEFTLNKCFILSTNVLYFLYLSHSTLQFKNPNIKCNIFVFRTNPKPHFRLLPNMWKGHHSISLTVSRVSWMSRVLF